MTTVCCVVSGGKKNEGSGYGVKAAVDLAEMEKAQPLGEHRLAVDAVSVNRDTQKGSSKLREFERTCSTVATSRNLGRIFWGNPVPATELPKKTGLILAP